MPGKKGVYKYEVCTVSYEDALTFVEDNTDNVQSIMAFQITQFWHEISAFIYNFTCEITILSWQGLVVKSSQLV